MRDDLPTGTVTLLFTDIEGSTRLLEELGEEGYVTALAEHRRRLRSFRRALERRHIFGAEIAAKEMGYVPLRDALGLLALYAAEDSPKYGKAGTRWLGRLALESDARATRNSHAQTFAAFALTQPA